MIQDNTPKDLPQQYRGQIKVTARREIIDGKSFIRYSFEDNGIGWSLEEMPEINWVRYHNTKRLVESVGGKCDYKAVKGQGAIATFWFPEEMLTKPPKEKQITI